MIAKKEFINRHFIWDMTWNYSLPTDFSVENIFIKDRTNNLFVPKKLLAVKTERYNKFGGLGVEVTFK